MRIIDCTEPDSRYKTNILDLWNAEYARELVLGTVADLDGYLDKLDGREHLLLVNDAEQVFGWLLLFRRDGLTWFAVIVHRSLQGTGYGTMLLEEAKSRVTELNGWVIDRPGYCKADGSPYPVPLAFYQKQGFAVLEERLEDKISAVRIRWQRGGGQARYPY